MSARGLALPVAGSIALAAIGACSTTDDLAPIPPEAVADVRLAVERRFPTEARPGVRLRGCVYASPQAIDDAGARRVVVVDGGGDFVHSHQ